MSPFVPVPLCLLCKHFHEPAEAGAYTCEAFPLGIPRSIYGGAHDHRDPFHEEDKLLFEPVSEAAAAYAAIVFRSAGPSNAPSA